MAKRRISKGTRHKGKVRDRSSALSTLSAMSDLYYVPATFLDMIQLAQLDF